MELQENQFQSDDNHSEQTDKPNAYQVDDDDNLEEKDLKRNFLFSGGDDEKNVNEPGMEGKGMGGQNFGENNITPAGNDKANPSQVAGDNNEYFNRTQPAEEHPEDNNFKDPNQAGQSNYSQAMDASKNGRSDENDWQNAGGNADSSQQTGQQGYQEGTADNDGKSEPKQGNIPGPNEVPDQQKVGE